MLCFCLFIQVVQCDPHNLAKLTEGHQRFGGDERRVRKLVRQLADRKGMAFGGAVKDHELSVCIYTLIMHAPRDL